MRVENVKKIIGVFVLFLAFFMLGLVYFKYTKAVGENAKRIEKADKEIKPLEKRLEEIQKAISTLNNTMVEETEKTEINIGFLIKNKDDLEYIKSRSGGSVTYGEIVLSLKKSMDSLDGYLEQIKGTGMTLMLTGNPAEKDFSSNVKKIREKCKKSGILLSQTYFLKQKENTDENIKRILDNGFKAYTSLDLSYEGTDSLGAVGYGAYIIDGSDGDSKENIGEVMGSGRKISVIFDMKECETDDDRDNLIFSITDLMDSNVEAEAASYAGTDDMIKTIQEEEAERQKNENLYEQSKSILDQEFEDTKKQIKKIYKKYKIK